MTHNGPPVTIQPSATGQQMMGMHTPHVNPVESMIRNSPYLAQCPAGMQYLIPAAAIMVRQQIDVMEVLTGWEHNNRYEILDGNGIRMYFAAENSDGLSLMCMGSSRLFKISILDNAGRHCLLIERTENSMCCNCNGNVVQVVTADNRLVGRITQLECCSPVFCVEDDQGQERLRISGPNRCCMCGEVPFEVTENGNPIGEIRKHYGGYFKEALTNADTFGMTVPVNLHPQLKCLLLGAIFLIDFMFFEERKDNQRRRGRYGHY